MSTLSPPSAAVPAPPPPLPDTPTKAMVLTLGGVAALCGLIIVGAYQGSLSAVQDNRRVALERAIAQVLPGAARTVSWLALPDGKLVRAASVREGEAPAGALSFHAAYDASGALSGIAAEGAAKGYADTVRVLIGWQPACQCVVGLGVISMRETPGIGDKILVDEAFKANFKALDVKLNAEMNALAHEVKAVKHGSKSQPWQVDAISGATVTSRAVGRAVNDAAQTLLPRLVPQLDSIRKAPAP